MKKEDLRVRRTRKLLLEALFDLMQNVPYDKISVSDICDKAMVHRATFYNHFKDKNDLLNYGLDGIQEKMFEFVTSEDEKGDADVYEKLVSKSIDFFAENREKIALVLANGSEKLYKTIFEASQRSIRYILSKNRGSKPFDLPLEVITNFLAGGICCVGVSQITSKKPYSKAEMMSFFTKLAGVKKPINSKEG